MKILDHFIYRTQRSWRPQPIISNEETLNLMGICFSWGEIDLSQKAFENIRMFVEASLNQSEVTNPFGFNESLSSLENALYSGCSLANEVIYKIVNSSTLTCGIEGVWIVKNAKEIVLVQVGQPQVYLLRNKTLIPLFNSFDIISKNPREGAFIPSNLLGIYSKGTFNLKSFSYEKNDELLFLAHSLLPPSIFEMSKKNNEDYGKYLFQEISKEFPNSPFWISRLVFE